MYAFNKKLKYKFKKAKNLFSNVEVFIRYKNETWKNIIVIRVVNVLIIYK